MYKASETQEMSILMQSTLSRLGHVLLATDQNANLFAYLSQAAHDLAIAIHEPHDRIWNTGVLGKLHTQRLCPPQVMSRNSREHVMRGLEL